jgi:GNAT superfamily N-acetyltransferase
VKIQVKIRPAVMSDYDQLCELFDEVDDLHRRALPDIFRQRDGPVRSRERVSHLISEPTTAILVAERDGCLLGLAVLVETPASTNPLRIALRATEIVTMVVRKYAHRQGIGKSLLTASLDWAKQHGAERVELSVYAFNDDALRLYATTGFEMLSHRMVLPLPLGTNEEAGGAARAD